jgi:hypothetical protein
MQASKNVEQRRKLMKKCSICGKWVVRRHAEKVGNMKSGDRIVWKNKRGEYIGGIRHTRKHRGKKLAMVQFDGNKRVSRVPIDEIAAEQKMHPTDGGLRVADSLSNPATIGG